MYGFQRQEFRRLQYEQDEYWNHGKGVFFRARLGCKRGTSPSLTPRSAVGFNG